MDAWVRVRSDLDKTTRLAIGPGFDFRYLAGWSPLPDERPTWLVVGSGAAALVIASVNADEAEHRLSGRGIQFFPYNDGEPVAPLLKRALDHTGAGAGTLLLSDDARFDHARMWLDLAQAATLRVGLASDVLRPLRRVKAPEEQEKLSLAQRACDRGMEAGLSALAPGITEVELAAVINRAFLEAGADRAAFILVAFGEHTAYPHHTPGPARLTRGPVLLDIGCYRDGYASDMTRMAYWGGPPDRRFGECLGFVEEAVRGALAAVAPGVPCEAVDRAARDVLTRRGVGDRFVHRTGHGIGLEVHEPPSVAAGDLTVLEPGMAFSIEPGVYFPGEFGIRLEEVVVVEEHGGRILSQIPRALFVHG